MISRSLKQLAKELNIPIIALSQLNRRVENNTGDGKQSKRPQLSDLRESGAIEQDADIVCFIHRPEYYTRSGLDADGKDIRGLAEFIIAKHRSGSTEDVNMRFRAKFARFENWSEDFDVIQSTFESKLNKAVQPENLEVGTQQPASSDTPDFLVQQPGEQPTPF